MTPAETIAEEIEAIVMKAAAIGVNVCAYVQADPQGGIYFTPGIQNHIPNIRKMVSDIEAADPETLETFGGLSYGL